jgi:hypothetical protein
MQSPPDQDTILHPSTVPPSSEQERKALIENLHRFTTRRNRITSHESYFNAHYAEWAQNIIDQLLKNQDTQDFTVVVPYKGRAKATVLNMWYQGFKFLVGKDPVYAAMKRQIVASTKPNFLSLRFKRDKEMPETYAHQAWRAELISFLETAGPGDLFKQDMLSLSTEEVDQARGMVAPLAEDFDYRIDTHIIWVARKH